MAKTRKMTGIVLIIIGIIGLTIGILFLSTGNKVVPTDKENNIEEAINIVSTDKENSIAKYQFALKGNCINLYENQENIKERTEIEKDYFWVKVIDEMRKKLFKDSE